MRTMPLSFSENPRDWQLAIVAGVLGLTLIGASVDRRNASVDRSVVSSRSVESAVAPQTSQEMVREMMTHD